MKSDYEKIEFNKKEKNVDESVFINVFFVEGRIINFYSK